MDFRTIIPIKPSSHAITHAHTLLMLGSCFTENIGERLQSAKFKVDVNPFGIQYNPLSIAQTLQSLMEKKVYTQADLFKHESHWHSFMHHSRFSDSTVDGTLDKINKRIVDSTDALGISDFLIITFGTAWVYTLKESGVVVSNCHKMPDTIFDRRRLSVDEIVKKYTKLIQQLNNSTTQQIIFTVSPIRHWKDGAHENNLSKAVLLLAIEQLQEQFDNVSYFPAYELVMDELRDYRFYAEDMLHPNSMAIDYIWEKFADSYFSSDTKRTAQEMEKLSRALAHRPFNTEGEEYRKFCEQQLNKIKHLEKAYPEIDFESEKEKIAL